MDYLPIGQNPVRQAWDRRSRFSTISDITLGGELRRPRLVFRLVSLEFKYSPKLKPGERVWNHTKYARLPDNAPTDSIGLRSKFEPGLSFLGTYADSLPSLISHTGLPTRAGI